MGYLEDSYPQVVHKGEINRKALNEWGHESDTSGRACRLLAEEGEIIVVYDKKGYASYQHNGDGFNEDIQLKAILCRIAAGKPLWDNGHLVKEVNKALESKNIYYKRGMIDKYKKYDKC